MKEILLLEKAKNGNKDAYCELFNRYYGLIFLKANKFNISYSEKEDFLQEGRIAFFKAIHSYDCNKGASFSTFASLCIERRLITVYKNINNLKSKMIRMAIMNRNTNNNESEIHNTVFSLYDNPEALLLSKEKIIYLRNSLRNNLSKMESEVMEYLVLGLTYLEIAEKTGRTPKTIDNAIQRIKRKIKQSLKY